ncbi:unnamed protein product [Bursaphelenchus okinawaensis]|uniref:Cystatin domain-containing protein n=1 Tax=Bursaphelenchus okinawaensis TaxID=465554 RepID=A0A811KC07_9BILA|nr:unnamed protein product [Bursaphelenchus okinawaensis]CAG9101317.1 unnamed protein product [Bursaphelenchus okinawaensis]
MFARLLTVAVLVGLGCQACDLGQDSTGPTINFGSYKGIMTEQLDFFDQKVISGGSDDSIGVPQSVNKAFKKALLTKDNVDTFFQSNPLLIKITAANGKQFFRNSTYEFKVTAVDGDKWVLGKSIYDSLCQSKPTNDH